MTSEERIENYIKNPEVAQELLKGNYHEAICRLYDTQFVRNDLKEFVDLLSDVTGKSVQELLPRPSEKDLNLDFCRIEHNNYQSNVCEAHYVIRNIPKDPKWMSFISYLYPSSVGRFVIKVKPQSYDRLNNIRIQLCIDRDVTVFTLIDDYLVHINGRAHQPDLYVLNPNFAEKTIFEVMFKRWVEFFFEGKK